jgi:hypothetical protein
MQADVAALETNKANAVHTHAVADVDRELQFFRQAVCYG